MVRPGETFGLNWGDPLMPLFIRSPDLDSHSLFLAEDLIRMVSENPVQANLVD